jgi:ATP-dependent RNA helicase RhlE
VINYDIPATADAYTHRIGRTGRACATGDAITFVSGEDRGLVSQIARILGSKLKYGAAKGFGGAPDGPQRPSSSGRPVSLRAAMPAAATPKPRSHPASRYRPMDVSQRRPFHRAAKPA